MKNRADKHTDDDEEQHVRDTFAAKDFAEKMGGENEQADDGDGQPDLP